jgi:hypothetical protein
VRVWEPPDGLPKAFCGVCGGQLYSDGGDYLVVRLGAVDGDPGIRPEWHQWLESAPGCEPIPDDGPAAIRAAADGLARAAGHHGWRESTWTNAPPESTG